MESGTDLTIKYIWGPISYNLFAVGEGGMLLTYNGTAWSDVDLELKTRINTVWETSGDCVFIGTASGDILHFNGEEWTEMFVPETESINKIWGNTADNIYAVTTDGTILHFDGTGWTINSQNHPPLYAIWGTPDGETIITSGSGGTLLRLVDGTWKAEESNSNRGLFGIRGSSEDAIYATGTDGTLLYFDGEVWSEQKRFTTENLSNVWGARNTVIVVGNFGMITEE